MNNQLNDLSPWLKRFDRRLRLRDLLRTCQNQLWLPAMGILSLQAAARLWPLEGAWSWSAIILAGWALAILAWYTRRPQDFMRVARRVDAELELKERLSTAVALGHTPPGQDHSSGLNTDLVILQRQDALAVARTIDPARAIGLRFYRRPIFLAGVIWLLIIVLTLFPNPMDDIIAERAEVTRAAQQQAERIEELREEIVADEDLSPEERQALAQFLAELVEKLRANQGDRAEALADLSRTEIALLERMDLNMAARQAALEALAAQLQSLARDGADEKKSFEEAASALQELASRIEEMDPTERQAMSETLAQLAARAAQAGELPLAQSLSQMSQAANAGDAQSAIQAARDAGQAFERALADQANQAAIQRALSQIQGARQAVARAGQGEAMAGNGNQGQQGQGDEGQGQGQGAGQGQGQGSQAGGGGGTTADTLPPATRTGTAARPQGQGQSDGERPWEAQVYVPWERRSEGDDPLVIPGQDTGEGQTQVRERPDPFGGVPGEALVPYQEVFYTYLDVANQTIDQSYIPTGLKDFVKAYFSNLEP